MTELPTPPPHVSIRTVLFRMCICIYSIFFPLMTLKSNSDATPNAPQVCFLDNCTGNGFLMIFLTWKGRGLVPGMHAVCQPGRTCILTFVFLGFLRNFGGEGEPSDCLKGGRTEWYDCKHGSEEISKGLFLPIVLEVLYFIGMKYSDYVLSPNFFSKLLE